MSFMQQPRKSPRISEINNKFTRNELERLNGEQHDLYAGWKPFQGGRGVLAILGPFANDRDMRGCVPESGECTCVDVLRKNGQHGEWVKGHLLNENLGGPGKSWNLTPMLDATNKQYAKRVESRIINAVIRCRQIFDFHTKQHLYGVTFEAVVIRRKDRPPIVPSEDDVDQALNAVADRVRVRARYVKINLEREVIIVDRSDDHIRLLRECGLSHEDPLDLEYVFNPAQELPEFEVLGGINPNFDD